MENQKLNTKLKSKNMSFTQQRRVVLEELEKRDDHLTADQVYMLVKKRMPKVSIGTIYRNLTTLVEIGLIDKLTTSLHGESFYEPHKDSHYHIVCTKCLRIDDLEHYRALSIEPTASKITGYEISEHLVELHGICPKCKNTELPPVQLESTADQETVLEEPAQKQPEPATNKIVFASPNQNTSSRPPVQQPQYQQATSHQQTPQSQNRQTQQNTQQTPQKQGQQTQQNNNRNQSYHKKKKKFFFGKRSGL